jgi:histidinol-phosphate aminotransferase
MAAALQSAHRYPESSGFHLRVALAKRLSLTPNHVILGSGSIEVLESIGHAFLRPGVDLVISEHAFLAYKVIAGLFGARAVEVSSRDLRHNLAAMADAITPETRVIFIANPNSPTGTLVTQNEIDRFVERVPRNVIIVFDEAYFEYVNEPPDALRFVRDGRNVIVLRTFSKFHGLAGLRIGYGIAQPELIRFLEKTRQPFHVNAIAQAGALAALGDEEHGRETKRATAEGRAFLESEFRALNLEVVPSAANFILVRVGDAACVAQALLRRHIFVADLKGYDLGEWIRVSVGTREQNEKCVVAMQEIRAPQLSPKI